MTKFERRQFFERLCELRALYALRGSDDATSGLSIDDAIAYAAQLFTDGTAHAAVAGAGSAASLTAPDIDRS